MIITEARITMPMTVEEYQVGMLYSVVEASKNETGGGEGVEVLKNEPYTDHPLLGDKFDKGQYTKKIYHLESKVPSIIKYIAPKGSLKLFEEAWNASDYCRTVITNPDYMKENFMIKLETFCLPDRGDSENVHNLPPELLAQRKVVHIDIANDTISEMTDDLNPTKVAVPNAVPPRGPLQGPDWSKTVEPVMTVYKLVTIEFKWFGLQGNIESFINNYEIKLFNRFHKQIYCSMPQWAGMTMENIRELEEKAKSDLEEQRNSGTKRGTEVIQ